MCDLDKLIPERFSVHTKIDITLSDLSIFRTKSFVMEIQRETLELCLSYRVHFYCYMFPKIELALFTQGWKRQKPVFPKKVPTFPVGVNSSVIIWQFLAAQPKRKDERMLSYGP